MIKEILYFEDGTVTPFKENTEKITKSLLPNIYMCKGVDTNAGWKLNMNILKFKESFKPYKTTAIADLEKYLNMFMQEELRDKFKKLNFTHKLGIILYGRAGTGKTNLLKHISNTYKDKCCIYYCDNYLAISLVNTLIKELNQDTFHIILFDECEKYMKDYENEFKQLLDGVNSSNNTIYLFCTNYLNIIPDTIKKRPSRIRYNIELKGIEDVSEIKMILDNSFDKINLKVDTKMLSKKLINSTIDQIKTTIINYCMGIEEIDNSETIGFKQESKKNSGLFHPLVEVYNEKYLEKITK